MIINCVLSDPKIILPQYETDGVSGMDLRAWKYSEFGKELDFGQYYFLRPYHRTLIKTGLQIEIPEGMEAQIRPRSGLALKHGITVLNTPGTIDSSYRGDIGVILINFGKDPYPIKRGDRIAQLVFQKVEIVQLNIVDKLSITERGVEGFGSTGME